MSDCMRCGREIQSWESWAYSISYLCLDCYNIKMTFQDDKTEICGRCGIRLRKADCNYTFGVTMCQQCYNEEKTKREQERCVKCGKFLTGERHTMPNGRAMCLDCYRKEHTGGLSARVCAHCGKKTTVYFDAGNNRLICPSCASKGYTDTGETTTIRKLKDLITNIIRSKG